MTDCLDRVEGAPGSPGPAECPYPGTDPFGTDQGQWFFGRNQAIKDLLDRLDERRGRRSNGASGPLVLVAPSGAGKSSLLAAGLIPALNRGSKLPGSETWQVVLATPQPESNPLVNLAKQVAKETGADETAAIQASAEPQRFPDWFPDFLKNIPAQLVLIVDEFEKIFIECQTKGAQETFVNALCAAAGRAGVLVVLGLRADFYGQCRTYDQLATALHDAVQLGPMDRAQLREIITAPANKAGRPVDLALVELLLRDFSGNDELGDITALPDPGALAWLAHALRETWAQRNGGPLTRADYESTGRIPKAIAREAEKLYTRLDEPEQKIAKQLLLRLVQVNSQARDVRLWIPRDKLLQNVSGSTGIRVLETLGRERLLTLGTHGETDNGNAQSVEIVHDDLLSWPRLSGWIRDREWRDAHQSLSADAEAWNNRGHDNEDFLLYTGSRLVNIRRWTDDPQYADQLGDLDNRFLAASVDKEDRERLAEEKAGRRRKRRRVQLCVLVSLLIMSSTYAGYQAINYEKLVLANNLVSTFRSMVAKQPDAAMLAAVEAFHLKEVPETKSALLSAQDQFYVGQLSMPVDGAIHTAMFSHDGRILVTAGDHGIARLWDVVNHRPLSPQDGGLDPRADVIFDAEFSPDDHLVVTAGKDGMVRRWRVDDRQQTKAFPVGVGTDRDLFAATFSHNGRILATAGKDGTARLLDVDSLQDIDRRLPPGHAGPVHSVRFSPDDRLLVTVGEEGAGKDGTARLWDVARREQITTLNGHTGHVNGAEFSRNGRILATVGDDTTARLWDVVSHQQISVLEGHTRPINAAAFSPDGQILLTGSDDGTARLWDVTSHQQIAAFRGTSAITGVAFSPDGHTVATVGKDSVVRLWDTRGPILISSPPTVGYDLVFSRDGRILATAGVDGIPRLWDMTNQHQIPWLGGHNGAIHAMAFNADGTVLATAGADGTVRLWNMVTHLFTSLTAQPKGVRGMAFSPDGHLLATVGDAEDSDTVLLWNTTTSQFTPLPGHKGTVRAVAFSPDGRMLATAGDDATVRLWDVASHTLIGRPLTGYPGAINKVAFSPDGHLLATASGDGYLLDSNSVTTTVKGVTRLWDVANQRLVDTLAGHTGNVETVTFSPDGRTVVTASDDRTVKLWDAETHELLATLTGHADVVYGAAFRPDGAMLATVGGDRTIHLWDLDVNRVTSRLCQIIGTVSSEQWTQVIPAELSYHPTCP